jgi:hypothetical protein
MSSSPSTSVNGSRIAAMTGGRIALSTAITAAARNAPPKSLMWTPGTTHAANMSAAADRIHATIRRSQWIFSWIGS